jgi:DNA-binding transcriptional LysR family regulator
MDIKLLSLFVDVAKAGGFAPVARDRGLDPSSVSRAIGTLEAQVQTRLFQRTTRVLSLTDAGELFFAQAPALIAGAAKLLDETATVGQKPVGTVRLTAPVAFGETCLIPLLERFHKTLPGLMLDLVLNDAPLCLITERIDLAIRLGEHHRGDLLGKQLFKTR